MDADHRLATLRAFASLIPETHHPDDLTRALRAGSTIRAFEAFEKAATDSKMNARLEAERSVSFAQLAPALRAIDHTSSPSTRSMTPAMWVTIVAAAAIVGIYFVQFGASFALSSSRDEWGTFGDYIGGLLNPLIGAFTAFLTWQIAMTIQRMQDRTAREELRESAAQARLLEQTRKEQERESREAISGLLV